MTIRIASFLLAIALFFPFIFSGSAKASDIMQRLKSSPGVTSTYKVREAITITFSYTRMTLVVPEGFRENGGDVVVYFPGKANDPWQPFYMFPDAEDGSLAEYFLRRGKALILTTHNESLAPDVIEKVARDFDGGLRTILASLGNVGDVYMLGESFGGYFGAHFLASALRTISFNGVCFVSPVSPVKPHVFTPLPEYAARPFNSANIPENIRVSVIISMLDNIVPSHTQMTLVERIESRTKNVFLIKAPADHGRVKFEALEKAFDYLEKHE